MFSAMLLIYEKEIHSHKMDNYFAERTLTVSILLRCSVPST